MSSRVLDFEKYTAKARQAVAEGQVLLINEEHTLPLQEGTRLAMFGRMQFHYYKSGTGSGGMVNVSKVTGILDALKESGKVSIPLTLVSAGEMSHGARWKWSFRRSLSVRRQPETMRRL